MNEMLLFSAYASAEEPKELPIIYIYCYVYTGSKSIRPHEQEAEQARFLLCKSDIAHIVQAYRIILTAVPHVTLEFCRRRRRACADFKRQRAKRTRFKRLP